MNINAKTKLCASLAFPNQKTLAPIMYNAGFDHLGLNICYVALEPRDICGAMSAIKTLNFTGTSISQPYKEEVIKFLDEIDEVAKKIGAVNIVHNNNGVLKGYNSDWIGAIAALEECTDLANKTVAVLGAGGASRAIVYGLTLRGAKVHIFNRTPEKGKLLSQEFNAVWGGDFEKVGTILPEIIINATPVGRIDDSESPVSSDIFQNTQVVMDINVKKELSQLLKDAIGHGAITISGQRMFVLQGSFTFELFTGEKAPIEVMETALMEAMK